ncbi:MAG: hypothetical protein M3341_14055 [Actinomycetota bacterium]|nr:hypothetical protein [Actinomycetota bacterium]
MTEGSMPPAERPTMSHIAGEQEHLREDAGMESGLAQGQEPDEHLRERGGKPGGAERKDDDKSFIDKAREKLTGG